MSISEKTGKQGRNRLLPQKTYISSVQRKHDILLLPKTKKLVCLVSPKTRKKFSSSNKVGNAIFRLLESKVILRYYES